MRGWCVAVVIVTACGRSGFDPVHDVPLDDVRVHYDVAIDSNVLPRTALYVKASNTGQSDRFGQSIALSASGLLAVGAFQEASAATGVDGSQTDNSKFGAGAVYLFTRGSSTWTQAAYIKASNPDVTDQFGFTLALSNDGHTLAVNAPLEASNATGIDGSQTNNDAAASGAVYVFTDAGGSWIQQAYIKASNTDISDQFGHALALSSDGNTLVVGARKEDSGAAGVGANQTDNSVTDSGAVYVFTRVGTTWSQQAYIKPLTQTAGTEFGRNVAVSDDGNTFVASAPYDISNAVGINGDPTNTLAGASGAAYVFTRAGSTWSQQTYIKASNTNAGDIFGCNVSISGDGSTIAVGAYGEASSATSIGGDQLDNSAMDAGAVYVFARTGATWMQEAYVKSPNAETDDRFGSATALTRDGNKLVVSARAEDSAATGIDGAQNDNSATAAGAAYVYTRSAGQWTFGSYLKATNTGASDDFGFSIAVAAVSGTIAVGAPYEDGAATGVGGDGSDDAAMHSGAAYVFE
ncbi:MAG: FG-GAP repeat protein [Kofleriaceae bacterium]|nr:FG-GAP repeat protein [Kofleriaceae bacterium]